MPRPASDDRHAQRRVAGSGAPSLSESSQPSSQKLLDDLVAHGVASAATGVIGSPDRILWQGAAGWEDAARSRPTRSATLFDFASLTKPFVATLALVLDARGDLTLAQPLGEVFPQATGELARCPLGNLLRHRSGLAAWTPLYRRCRNRDRALRLLLSGALLEERRVAYSDLGYILWGMAAEAATGTSLANLLQREVLTPVRCRTVSASPVAATGVAACFLNNQREVDLARAQELAVARRSAPLAGSAQDGNARFLGGLAGHAGLFGTAADLWRLGREWLRPRRLLTPVAVRAALSGRGEYALGWARRRLHGSAGPALSVSALGHTGFTGGSLWIDPDQNRILVLLTHRIITTVDLNPWRRRFHASCLGFPSPGSAPDR